MAKSQPGKMGDPLVNQVLDLFLEFTGVDPEVVGPDDDLTKKAQIPAGQLAEFVLAVSQAQGGKPLHPGSLKGIRTLRDVYQILKKSA